VVGTHLLDPDIVEDEYECLFGRKIKGGPVKLKKGYDYLDDEEFEIYRQQEKRQQILNQILLSNPTSDKKRIIVHGELPEGISKYFNLKYFFVANDEIYEYGEIPSLENEFLKFIRKEKIVSKSDAREWLIEEFPFIGKALSNVYARINEYVKKCDNLDFDKGESTGGAPPQIIKWVN
jgi:hypothetical protein